MEKRKLKRGALSLVAANGKLTKKLRKERNYTGRLERELESCEGELTNARHAIGIRDAEDKLIRKRVTEIQDLLREVDKKFLNKGDGTYLKKKLAEAIEGLKLESLDAPF